MKSIRSLFEENKQQEDYRVIDVFYYENNRKRKISLIFRIGESGAHVMNVMAKY